MQTLSDATPSIGKIRVFIKIAILRSSKLPYRVPVKARWKRVIHKIKRTALPTPGLFNILWIMVLQNTRSVKHFIIK